MSTNIYLY